MPDSPIQRAAGLRPMFNTMLWFPDDNAIRPAVVSISSDQNADVASAYGRDLRKDAGRQFTKTRPAILAVELAALCWDDFLRHLNQKMGHAGHLDICDQIAAATFGIGGRPFLYGIMFFPGRLHPYARSAFTQLSTDYLHAFRMGYFCRNPHFDHKETRFPFKIVDRKDPNKIVDHKDPNATSFFFLTQRQNVGATLRPGHKQARP
jgi:hypothetical protein